MEEGLHVDADPSRSRGRLLLQVMGLRPLRDLRTPARIGAITCSRRVSRAAMVPAFCGSRW